MKIKSSAKKFLSFILAVCTLAVLMPAFPVSAAASTAVSFSLQTGAVQVSAPMQIPGATIQVSGTNTGVTYTKNDLFASQNNSGTYFFDSNTSGAFIINYLTSTGGSAGTGIGKITGTFDIDGNGDIVNVVATDIGGFAVPVNISGTGNVLQSITFTNPTSPAGTAANARVERTTLTNGYVVRPTPSNANVVFYDARDGSMLPSYWVFNGELRYALPVSNVNGATLDFLYSVTADDHVTATGKFSTTRTATGNGNQNTVVFTPDGNEESYTYNEIPNPKVASITLTRAATEYNIYFTVIADTAHEVTATIDDIEQISSGNGHFTIPFVNTDTILKYKIEAANYRTIDGQLLLKPDGTVEDITPQEEKDGTVAYEYSPALNNLYVKMMLQLPLVSTGTDTAKVQLSNMYRACFDSYLMLTGGRITGGKLEITNPTSNTYKITGIEIVGRPSLSHAVFRPANKAIVHLGVHSLDYKFSDLKGVVDLANAKYPGENFSDYYEYLLYYYKNIYVSAIGTDCSTITSLEELPPLDLQSIFNGLIWMDGVYYDGTPADAAAGLVYQSAGPEYAYIENDPRVAALGENLAVDYALNFTLNNAAAGPIPFSVSEMNEGNAGMQFLDYINHTAKNDEQISKMFNFVMQPGSVYRFDNIAMSINGDYNWNAFQTNALDLDFEIYFICEIVKEPEPTDKSAYTVLYNGNGNTGGTAPFDTSGNAPDGSNSYLPDSTVAILGPGNLVRENYIFMGWATTLQKANAGIVDYAYDAAYFTPTSFTINQDTILYAVWKYIGEDVPPVVPPKTGDNYPISSLFVSLGLSLVFISLTMALHFKIKYSSSARRRDS